MKLNMHSAMLVTVIAVIGLFGLLTGTSYALPILTGCGGGDFGNNCSLAELVAGGSIQIDDKLFHNWTYHDQDANLIEVTTLGEGTLDPGPGVLFTPTGGKWALLSGVVDDVGEEIVYDVSTTTGLATIHDNELILLGQIVGLGTLFIAEQAVYLPTDTTLADKFVSAVGPDTDSVIFPFDVNSVNVFTTVSMFTGVGDVAEIRWFSQTFSQTTVPEPSTMILLGSGLAGLGLLRRKRMKTS